MKMKKIIAIVIALTVMIAVGAEAKKKQAEIKFAEITHNFGTIPEKGGTVSHTFTFTNTGDANLVIVDAKADCGCTEPQYSEKPIAPGKQGKVKVTYNPLYRPGSFTKVITVTTNGKQKKVRLKITGTVQPGK